MQPLAAEQGAKKQRVRIGRVRWQICAMLFVATSINYMDRQVIGLLKPTLEHSIGLTEADFGYIIAAFQFAYAFGLLAAGRLVDALGSRVGYTLIMGTWSIAAMAHALASSAFGFGVARFFLGLGEAGNFPAAIKTVADWFPQSERSLATGIFNSGANVGAIIAPALIPWITLRFGWRAAFLATGLFSAVWIVWWYRNYRKPAEHPTLTGEELRHIYQQSAAQMGPKIPWLKLLTYRQTWAFAAAKFMTDPIWWFYLFWLPSFFDARFHLGLTHLGLPLILVYNFSAVGSIGGGWLPALFRRFGMDAVGARMATMTLCAVLALPIFYASRVHSEWAAIALLSLAAAAHQGWSANLFTTASDMFPSTAVGAVVGIGGMAGSLGGVLFSVGAGRLLQVTHSYSVLFGISASVYLLALLVLRLVAPGLRKAEFHA
ncbi:MFS transporter [Acidipila sp. EB88]|uniref:MFS transporter n=1 Tax=Acidipila sp. EB88 TaxID=2305226 RepID=UPI000F5D856A|nr:MFS transporter [Acidipila sp. EB88]RRA49427.1 MFS transporter [Acidipila sp. EB88]